MKLETAYAAHKGGRDEQQDRVAVLSAPSGEARLLVVADGMGGHAGGSLASQAVVDAAEAAGRGYDAKAGDPKALFKQIVETAHAAINAATKNANAQPSTGKLHLLNPMERKRILSAKVPRSASAGFLDTR